MKTWNTPGIRVLRHYAFDLLCMREANDSAPSILVRTPEAGHASWIASFAENQDLMKCILDNTTGGVYVMDQRPATYARIFEGISSLLDHVKVAVEYINDGPLHLVGLCQGGWVAGLFATKYPDLVCEYTLAATPIDTSFESVLKPAQELPIEAYHAVRAMSFGLIKGKMLIDEWARPNKAKHDAAKLLPENAKFYQWYDSPRDISGQWWVEACDLIFVNNKLLSKLKIRCPVNVVVGLLDPITPPEQVLAIQQACDYKIRVFESPGGHLGVFMGTRTIRDVWPKVFSNN